MMVYVDEFEMSGPAEILPIIWECAFGRKPTLVLREDNETCIVVARTGRNPTMRHLSRTHGVHVNWIHEVFVDEHVILKYCPSASQRADLSY